MSRRSQELPTLYLIAAHTTMPSSKTKGVPSQELPEPPVYTGAGSHFNTVHDYARAYQEGKTTPIEVANKNKA